MPSPSQPNPQRILVRGVNWLGDAIMTTPALHRLRERFPGAHITLLTQEKLADVWTYHPAINSVMTFGAHESVWQIARRLGQGGFDLGIALPNSPRSAMELWLARIPRRLGYADGGRRWLLTDPVEARPGIPRMHKRTESEVRELIAGGSRTKETIPPIAHHIYHYLHLVAACGADPQPLTPYIELSAEEIQTARATYGLSPAHAWFALNAGAEYGPAKRWPRERFIAAAIEFRRRHPSGCVIVGGKNDLEIASDIAAQVEQQNNALPVVNLAGKTTLRELCAIFKSCAVVLTNDTGPMHIAAAAGTPVVVPFGSTSPEFTGPGLPGDVRHFLVQSDAVCAPCFLRECPIDFRCMQGIAVESIVQDMVEAAERPRPQATR